MRKYTVLSKIGEGSFANVHKCRNDSTKELVAVKQLKTRFSDWEECKKLREVKSLTKLKHANIIKCMEVIMEKNKELYMVFEFAPRNLWQVISDQSIELDMEYIYHLFGQLLEGVAYMHSNNVFHRDIKPENLLLVDDTLKIADFGLAREIRSRPPYTEYVSTRWYRAPELLLQSGYYSSPVDIWACGCILGEMFLRGNLFPGESDIDMLHKICSKLGTFTKESWPEGMRQLSQRHLTMRQYSPLPLSSWFRHTQLADNATFCQLFLELLKFDPQGRISGQNALKMLHASKSNAQEKKEDEEGGGRRSNVNEKVRTEDEEGSSKRLCRQPSDIDIDAVLNQIMESKGSPSPEMIRKLPIGAMSKICSAAIEKNDEIGDIEALLNNLNFDDEEKLDDVLEEFLSSNKK